MRVLIIETTVFGYDGISSVNIRIIKESTWIF